MKKFTLFVLILLFASSIIIVRNNTPSSHHKIYDEMYLKDYEFNFILLYDSKDQYFLQKVHSMIDQNYQNYQIHLFINNDEHKIINSIKLYAKKMNKSHIIEYIHFDNEIAINLLLKNHCNQLNPSSILVFQDNYCIALNPSALNSLNDTYKSISSKILIFGNHISFPSLQKNTSASTYANSSLKTIYTSNIQTYNTEFLFSKGDLSTYIKNIAENTKIKQYYIDNPICLRSEKEKIN